MSPLCVAQSLCSCSVCKHPMKCPRYSLSGIWDSGYASGRKMRDEKKEELCKKIRGGGCIETPKFKECQTRRTCVVEIEKRLVFACVQTLGLVQLLLPFLLLRGRKGGGVGVPGALRRVPPVKQYQDEYLFFFWCYLCCNGHRDITVISLSYFAGFSPNRLKK